MFPFAIQKSVADHFQEHCKPTILLWEIFTTFLGCLFTSIWWVLALHTPLRSLMACVCLEVSSSLGVLSLCLSEIAFVVGLRQQGGKH